MQSRPVPFLFGGAMGFNELMAADFATIMAADDNGITATYTDPSGQTTSLTMAMVGHEQTETPEANGVITKLRKREYAWAAATLSDVNLRAKINIGTAPNDEDWSIAGVVHRDETQVIVRLERHELTEHTRPNYRRR